MRCSHPLCTGRHSGKYRIAELCPLAQEKRRASWRAYEDHLYQAQRRAYAERFGEPGTETWLGSTQFKIGPIQIEVRNPAVKGLRPQNKSPKTLRHAMGASNGAVGFIVWLDD